MKTTIEQIISWEIQEKVTITWFIDTIREHKKYIFMIVRQKTEYMQVFIDKEIFPLISLTHESYVKVRWKLSRRPEIKLHSIELIAEEIEILSSALEEPPITWKWEWYPSLSERLDHRHLSLREPKILLAFQLMSHFDLKIREFFSYEWFTEIHTPKIIWTSSEGWSELFEMQYFDKTAYLAQSPQIYKQMAIAAWFEKVFEIAPAFRADPSFTSRHVTEITMLDIEMWPIKSYHEIIDLEEKMLIYAISGLKERFWEKVKELYWIDIIIPKAPFPRLTFSESVKILKERFSIIIPEWEDMTWEWEKKLSEYIKETSWHDFLFITEYPLWVRAFYTKAKEDKASVSTWFDLIYRWLEITSWAQREHRHDMLKAKILEKWMWIDWFHHYLQAFRHGIPPHWWFGFWFARLFKQMLGFETIKEMILMPRDPKRIYP